MSPMAGPSSNKRPWSNYPALRQVLQGKPAGEEPLAIVFPIALPPPGANLFEILHLIFLYRQEVLREATSDGRHLLLDDLEELLKELKEARHFLESAERGLEGVMNEVFSARK